MWARCGAYVILISQMFATIPTFRVRHCQFYSVVARRTSCDSMDKVNTSGGWSRFCNTCLAKDPADRIRSAELLRQQLVPALRDCTCQIKASRQSMATPTTVPDSSNLTRFNLR